MIEYLSKSLKNQLLQGLPGEEFQHRMAPHRLSSFKYGQKPKDPKKSSVLILLYPFNKSVHVCLIQRPQYEGHHSGQVAFPGGKQEEEDTTLYDTALREAKEEIGINANGIEPIGELSSLFIPVSNFLVQPFIGILRETPSFSINKKEVEEVIPVPLSTLLDKTIVCSGKIQLGNGSFLETSYYLINNKKIWGATAMMISEFTELLKRIEKINELIICD